MKKKKPRGRKVRLDHGHPTPPPPHLPPDLRPVEISTPYQAPRMGITCSNPDCRALVCGRVPDEVKRKSKRTNPNYKPKFISSTGYRPGAIQRIRRCLFCGRRLLTVERVVSNAC